MSEPRRFTLDEAQALVPALTPLLERLRDAARTIAESQAAVRHNGHGNGGGHRQRLDATRAAEAALREIEDLGIVVRDPVTGLVDFLSTRDGKDVFLCWRLGEERIAWWHSTTSGFADRRSL